MTFKNNKAGVSLIIAILFVSAFLFVMAGLYEAQSKVYASLSNKENEAKAFYLAESAAELASYWAATHGVGESTPQALAGASGGGTYFSEFSSSFFAPLFEAASSVGISSCNNPDGDANTADSCVGFRVSGRNVSTNAQVQINGAGASYYSVPVAFSEGNSPSVQVRGTGDAAESCGSNNSRNADDPCHWNKLYAGESVEIPLYYEADANGNGTIDPGEINAINLSSGDFKLRVRAPCNTSGFEEPVGGCAVDRRIVLYPRASTMNPYSNPDSDKDPVLIQWMIVDAEGASTLLAGNDTLLFSGVKFRPAPSGTGITNTELSGGRINIANFVSGYLRDFIVLEKNHKGKNLYNAPARIDCFINSTNFGCSPSVIPTKPVLRLSLVGQPRREDDGIDAELDRSTERQFTPAQLNSPKYDVPFLEYQLLISNSSGSPNFSDNKSEIVSWINIGNFHKEIRLNKKRETSLGTFALESF